ncbi:MAG: bifunctional UDP-N-acetylglucosamine diphosphorylase/glucosamine-1-phosphate N-acetyltransferase GlmU [Woeseiaceae bacterium]|nr:bifunctional UDP-N-acetylglucosamine diphosphorylase/glucosamine-1-phosphate N-acetyltransferase GlmU [Woeseiaceae bacterium]
MAISIVILAAGQGTRMRSSLPKVLQLLAGRPLLRHVVECSKALGADDICVVYGHGGDAVRETFARDGLRWALQDEQLGTGHAAQQAMPETPDENQVLVLAGDVPLLEPQTLTRLVEACDNNEMGVLTVDMPDPQGYGRIVRDGEQIARIVEQKDADADVQRIREINTGVFRVPGGLLKKWLAMLGNDNSQGEYYLTDIVAMANADGIAVHGVKTDSWVEVMGINDKKQLAEAERALQARLVDELMQQGVGFADPGRVDIRGTLTCGQDVFIDVNAIFEGKVELGDRVTIESNNLIRDSRIGSGTVIHSNCHIEQSETAENCEIGPFARMRPGAKLANDVKIGNFVEIKKSTVADGSKVNHLTYIGDTEMGSQVNVGAGTITCNYDGASKHLTRIGDRVFIGSGVQLVAPIEIGADATIGAGSTLSKPAPAGKLTLSRARQVTVEGWKKPTKKPG